MYSSKVIQLLMMCLFLWMADNGSSDIALNRVALDRESLDVMHILQHSLFVLENWGFQKLMKIG